MPNKRWPLAALACLAAAAPASALADCSGLKAGFDKAVADKAGPGIIAAFTQISNDSSCDFDVRSYRRQALDGMIEAAAAAKDAAERKADLDWVDRRLAMFGSWRNADKLGAYFDRQGDRTAAMKAYEQAIELAKEKPEDKPTDAEWRKLALRASAGFRVVNDDNEGRDKQKKYTRALTNPDGTVGGVYSLLRAVAVSRLPLPINFVYRTAEITPAGQSAVKELADAVAQQNIHALRLVGYADPRGVPEWNLTLSKQRAEAAATALKADLSQTHPDFPLPTILTDGKGAADPFDVSVLNYDPTQEEIWALDRRVEFELVKP